MFTSARIRLTAWYVAALALFLLALGTAVYQLLEHQLRSNVDNGLRSTSARAQAQYAAEPEIALSANYGASYTVSWSDGSAAPITPNGSAANRPSVLAALRHRSDMRTIRSTGVAERVYSYALPGKRHLVVQVTRSLEPEEDALHGLLAYMFLAVAGSLALAAAGGWFLAGKSLAPVRAAFERQQAFVGDASHELRTPLAVIRANAEFLQQGQPESEEAREILAETDRLTALVDSLLALARGQGTATPERQLDLGALVSDSAHSMRSLASDRKVALTIATAPGLEVEGDPDQLRRLVVILVDNALRYTPAGGRVTVDARRHNGTAVVAVSDTGIGIPADALQHVFERFYRADGARNRASGGAGLGLSIAEQLVTAHGGRISAESAPGQGSTFTISLPLGRGA